MHTIDIVRMPAGRPAHPRSTPITEPRTAACSKLRHSCSSSAKVIAATLPPRSRCNDWVGGCGDLPVTLRRGESVLKRGESVLEKLKRGEWLLATPANTTANMVARVSLIGEAIGSERRRRVAVFLRGFV